MKDLFGMEIPAPWDEDDNGGDEAQIPAVPDVQVEQYGTVAHSFQAGMNVTKAGVEHIQRQIEQIVGATGATGGGDDGNDDGKRVIPWRRLGIQPGHNATAQQGLDLYGRYEVVKRQLECEGKPTPYYGLWRPAAKGDEGEWWGSVTSDYTPIQPADICTAWDKLVKKPIDALGAARRGRVFFITHIERPVEIKAGLKTGDPVIIMGSLQAGLDGTASVLYDFGAWRVACTNGVTHHDGKKGSFTIAHTANAVERLMNGLTRLLGESVNQAQIIADALETFARTPMSKDVFEATIPQVYPIPEGNNIDWSYGKAQREKRLVEIERQRVRALGDRLAVWELFDGAATGFDAPQMRGTVYGFVQAVAEYEQHLAPSKNAITTAKDTLFGERLRRMNKAYALAERLV